MSGNPAQPAGNDALMRATGIFAFGRRLALAALIVGVAACAGWQRPPSRGDIDAKRFETVPDKAVIYLFRTQPDLTRDGASIMLDDRMLGTTYPGTYFRLELAPGQHRIAGFSGDSGNFEFIAEPGRLYFIEQSVMRFIGPDRSLFRRVSEDRGRQSVLRSELIETR